METYAIICPPGVWTPLASGINEILVKMRTTGAVRLVAGSDEPDENTTNYMTVNNSDGPVGAGYATPFSVWVRPEGDEPEVVEGIRG